MHQLKFYDRGAQHLHSASVERVPNPTGKSAWEFTKSFTASGRPDSLIDKFLDQVTDARVTNESPIHAYWLPFKMNRTYEMDLGSQADYFFTAGLSGCTVAVGGNPRAPHVAHINRMDGPELQGMFEKLVPMSDAELLERQRARATGEHFQRTTPKATKAETTTRQVLLQELKALAATPLNQALGTFGRNLRPSEVTKLRGNNYAPRDTGGVSPYTGDAVTVGGPRQGGNYIFGVLDFEEHYKGLSALEATANVVGYRNTGTGNWHFVYQVFGSTGHKYYMRDPLRCLICREKAENCTCPP
jgi:hypothetical protein